jgi:hypothetical protein
MEPLAAQGKVGRDSLPSLLATVADLDALVVLTLSGPGTQRTLWLRGEELEAASTGVPHESFLDQARKDGLIDSRQELSLRSLRFGPLSGLVQALLGKGLLRVEEVPPLVERHTEAIVLAALGDAEALYDVRREEQLPIEALSEPRPIAPLLAEALRRTAPTDEVILRDLSLVRVLPGAVFESRERFGLTERERRVLRSVDGTRQVKTLLEEGGGPPEWLLRALGWWIPLHVVALEEATPPVVATPPGSLTRLTAKLAEAEEADYFAILGVSRQATRDEIQKAFSQLAEEFGPLHFDQHPDVRVRRNAQKLREVLSEAAQVLSDDRLRAEYSRNLLD